MELFQRNSHLPFHFRNKLRYRGRYGHFSIVCCQGQRTHAVNAVEEEETYFLGAVDALDTVPPWHTTLAIGSFKIDTGADVSVMSCAEHNQLCPRPRLQHTNAVPRRPRLQQTNAVPRRPGLQQTNAVRVARADPAEGSSQQQ